MSRSQIIQRRGAGGAGRQPERGGHSARRRRGGKKEVYVMAAGAGRITSAPGGGAGSYWRRPGSQSGLHEMSALVTVLSGILTLLSSLGVGFTASGLKSIADIA